MREPGYREYHRSVVGRAAPSWSNGIIITWSANIFFQNVGSGIALHKNDEPWMKPEGRYFRRIMMWAMYTTGPPVNSGANWILSPGRYCSSLTIGATRCSTSDRPARFFKEATRLAN